VCEAQYRQSGAAAQWIRWDSRWPRPSAPAGRPTGLDRKIYDGSNEPGQRSRPNCPDGAHAAPKGSEYQQIGLSGVRPAQSGGGLGRAVDLQFLQDAVHVVFDRGDANRQLARDFLVGAASPDEYQDFAFA